MIMVVHATKITIEKINISINLDKMKLKFGVRFGKATIAMI